MSEKSSGGESTTRSPFGFKQLLIGDPPRVAVVVGSESDWSEDYLAKLNRASSLSGVVPLLDVDFTDDDKPYATHPILDLPTFEDLIEDKDTTWQNKVGALAVASETIQTIHDRDLIHGGLNPSAILVRDDEVIITPPGLGLGGTLPLAAQSFSAPELQGEEKLDATRSSDIFAIGALLGACLESAKTPPRSLSRLAKWAQSEVPETRPPSAQEMATVMQDALGAEAGQFRPGYVATSPYLGLIEEMSKDNSDDEQPADDGALEFDEVKQRIEDRRAKVAATAAVAAEDNPGLFIGEPTETEEEDRFGLMALVAAALLTLFLGYWALRDNEAEIAEPNTTDTIAEEQVSAPTTAEEDSSTTTQSSETTSTVPEGLADVLTSRSGTVAISAEADGLQIINTAASQDLDLYIDGKFAVAGFTAGTLAGPATSDTAEYDLALYKSAPSPAAAASDRTDEPVTSQIVSFASTPEIAVISDSGNEVEIEPANFNTRPIPAGQVRVAITNSTNEAISVELADTEIEIDAARTRSVVVDADPGLAVTLGKNDGLAVDLGGAEGELVGIYAFGEGADTQISEIRITGLESAPAQVPTGDSGLADNTAQSFALTLLLLGLGFAIVKGRRSSALS